MDTIKDKSGKHGKSGQFAESRWFVPLVLTLRVLVGGVFVMSGFVKSVDLWGFVFKIEEYLAVWGITQPRSVVFLAALFISGYEFVFGALLIMGCYKRLATWALTATMAVMLPLTFYIAVADPVSDCGCFGDFWVISNVWTFLKNLLLTAMLVVLLKYNTKCNTSMYQPAIQWIVGAWISLYIILISLYGYNVQPVADFRGYALGTQLIDSEDESAPEDIAFLYERDGEQREFGIDNLPDSTWQFVRRIEGAELKGNNSPLAVFDADGEDVTEDVIMQEGREVIVVIPELQRSDISYTYFLNDLKQWCDTADVDMICLLGSNERGVEIWRDISMADYDVYYADDTQLKELSRGNISLVVTDSGVIKDKFTLSSVNPALLEAGPSGHDFLERMAPHPQQFLRVTTGVMVAVLLVIYLFQNLILAVYASIKKYSRKKRVTLQDENDPAKDMPEVGEPEN